MQTQEVIERLNDELGIVVNRETMYFYDRINLVTPTERYSNRYRNYTENDYQRLKLAIALREIGYNDLESVDLIINKGNPEAINELKEKCVRNTKIGEFIYDAF